MPTPPWPHPRLVFLRGNSASGKTTTARAAQRMLGHGRCVVVSQDVVRREVLWVPDDGAWNAVTCQTISDLATAALRRGQHVIVEGILYRDRYAHLVESLAYEGWLEAQAGRPGWETRCLYFNVDLAETLRRHAGRPQADEFGPEWLHTWWRADDRMDALGEVVIGADQSEWQVQETVLDALGVKMSDIP